MPKSSRSPPGINLFSPLLATKESGCGSCTTWMSPHTVLFTSYSVSLRLLEIWATSCAVMWVDATCYHCHLLVGDLCPTVAGTYALPLLCSLLYCASCPDILPGEHWADPLQPSQCGVNECTLTITGRKVTEDVMAMGRNTCLFAWNLKAWEAVVGCIIIVSIQIPQKGLAPGKSPSLGCFFHW